ncbi:hypothetical protein BDR07DRAFT_137445 [Suillus spraguei]|nr:hypothetical protein BDR07DRAFT_137445 [Suillus spraguei]
MSSQSNLRSRARGGLSTIFDYVWTRLQRSPATLPTSHPVPVLSQTPRITVSSPGGSLTPQKSLPLSRIPSAGTTSVATASGACAALGSNINPSSSGISVPLSTVSPSIPSIRKAKPIPASEVNRYKRKRPIPQTKDRVFIKPGEKVFKDRWKPLAHPEGALYYYDSTRRIYTDADLSRPSTLSAIEAFIDKLYNDAQANSSVDITKDAQCIFWLESFDAESLFENIRRVRNMGHIKHAIEAQYWTHCELFPYENRVTPVVLEELKQMIMHAAAVTLTSATSVSPFDKDELEKMLDLVMNIEGTLEGEFTHTRCVVARFMSEFTKARFFNFCGQPGARLDSDQTIYFKDHDHQSLLFIITSFLLFGAPRAHQEDLNTIWVDRIINRVLWNQFMGKLNDEWTGLALSATVILNANMAFLAISSVQDVAKLLSYLSTACSIAVVLLVLLLVRQNQQKDCERASFFTTGTEALAITYSLPYGLLMWALLCFAAGLGNLIFGTENQWTRGAVGFVASLVVCFVALVVRIGRYKDNPKDEESTV